jgi:hypothetical protein
VLYCVLFTRLTCLPTCLLVISAISALRSSVKLVLWSSVDASRVTLWSLGGGSIPPRDCFKVLGGGSDPSGSVLRYWGRGSRHPKYSFEVLGGGYLGVTCRPPPPPGAKHGTPVAFPRESHSISYLLICSSAPNFFAHLLIFHASSFRLIFPLFCY